MDKIIPSFKDSLFNGENNIKDDLLDIAEFGIDSILDDGVLKDIPIVRTLVGIRKTAQNIQDRNLLKQTLTFINEFNSGTIDEEKLKKYQNEINNDSVKAEKELGRIIILLDRFIENEKSKMLARLYKAYINQKITWDEFCEFSEIINRLFIQDIGVLTKMRNLEIDTMYSKEEAFKVERLHSLGLAGIAEKPLTWGDLKDGHVNMVRALSIIGRKFYDIVLKEK